MLACVEGFLCIVKLLVQNGADVSAENEDGDTPLHMCLLKHMLHENTGNLEEEQGAVLTHPTVDEVRL